MNSILSNPFLIGLVVILFVALLIGAWLLGKKSGSSGASADELALRALDDAAKVVASLKNPGPDQQAAVAAAEMRRQAYRQSIAASMATIAGPVPPAAS